MFTCCLSLALLAGIPPRAQAGGSGLNVLVVVNEASTNSLQLGNYYCEQRGVPPQNVLRIHWTGSPVTWTKTEFETTLLAPFTSMLAARQLTNQVEYLLLSMDIPYRVTETSAPLLSGVNATTAALHYGFFPDGCLLCPGGYPSCNLPAASKSAYAGSEGIFRETPPSGSGNNSWLVMMLASSSFTQARAVVDRGVAADYSFPTQTIMLATSPDDRLRRIRKQVFDNAMINVRLRDNAHIARTNAATPAGLGTLFGYAGGDQVVPSLAAASFVPGAMADNLTSFSGYLLEYSGHTDALQFLNAGATASYGTVVEPCAYLAKFPSAQNYFYQARGFSLAESYYQSITNPYQGILIGEPLSAPFAVPATGTWLNPPPGAVLSGTTNLTVQFASPTTARPPQRVDLFLNGQFQRTLTNIAPAQGNVLHATINGFPTNYTVPAGATLKSIASNVTARWNRSAYTNLTKVRLSAHGDRVGLVSLDITRAGENTALQASNHIGSAGALTTFLHPARTNFLDRVAHGVRAYVLTNSAVTVAAGQFLRCVVIKTNNSVVTVAVTNTTPGIALNQFAPQFFAAISTNLELQAIDGLSIENINLHEDEPYRTYVYGPNDHSGEFDVRARSPGWPESQVRVAFSGSANFSFTPSGTNRLDSNIADLQPRNHLYVTAGVTNLPLTFPFNTTTNADGHHELTIVAYEGSHVRTQTRLALPVRIQNTPLAATFEVLYGATNTDLSATLQFRVTANTNNASVNRVELFSTGGPWGVVSNSAIANFSLPATNLHVGLHPFHALVTRADGKQYRTETHWIRLIDSEPPFALTVIDPTPPTLTWPATAGRTYQIWSTTNQAVPLVFRASITPSNHAAIWMETEPTTPQRFYQVRTAP